MEPTEANLTPRQERAIAALIAEPTHVMAAEKANVPLRTLKDWLHRPDFKAAFQKARRETFTQAMSMATRYAPMALQTLLKISSDPSAPHAARVSASTAVLKFGRESMELDHLAERIEHLEQTVGSQKPDSYNAGQRAV
ncbi:MAG: hypothetical protein JSR77_04435 [Planctomycetes bacterium]|nr:hypothetical protein [Planctomycetota bacterium]